MYTQEDLQAIDEAIASGERRARLPNGMSIEQRSADDLIKLRNYIERRMLEQQKPRRRPRAVVQRPV